MRPGGLADVVPTDQGSVLSLRCVAMYHAGTEQQSMTGVSLLVINKAIGGSDVPGLHVSVWTALFAPKDTPNAFDYVARRRRLELPAIRIVRHSKRFEPVGAAMRS